MATNSVKITSTTHASVRADETRAVCPQGANDDFPPPEGPPPAAPAGRLCRLAPLQLDCETAFARLEAYNRSCLRDRNECIQSDPSRVIDLETDLAGLLDWPSLSDTLQLADLGRSQARALLKQFSFPLASLNRHYLARAAGGDSCSGETKLTEFFASATGVSLPNLLAGLANVAKHPPYQSYASYWLSNSDNINFTKDSGETYFRTAVNKTNHRFARAAELLRPLQTGDIPLDSAGAVALVDTAADEIKPLIETYNFRLKNAETGEQRLTPNFFMNVMRGYIAPVILDEAKIEGPNATYSPGWPRVDFAIDNRKPFYTDIVHSRYRWMLPEHRALLDQALELPSFIDQLVQQTRLTRGAMTSAPIKELRAVFEIECPALVPTLIHYARLVSSFNMISGTHISMIRNYLTKPAQALSEQERARIVPRPDGGVGGNPLGHTDAILRMRRTHPINAKLIELARQWSVTV